MLTIKSNFNNFRDRQGQLYIAEDLDKLCKALVTSDIVNFPVKKEMSAGYTEAIAWKIAERLVLIENGKYLVINDISLQVANALTDLGVKPENIYLAYGKWKKNAVPDTDPTLYLLMKQYIKANIVETFNIIKLEEIFTLDIKFNGVIANPPYGKIGAQITEKIKDNIDYEQYINLLPANDYKRYNKIYQFVRNMETVKDGFADAAVTTHLCEIVKEANDMSADDFEISQYADPQLDKYFRALRGRTHYAIDSAQARPRWTEEIQRANVHNSFIIHMRDANHGYIPNKGKSTSVQWNIDKALTLEYIHDNHWQNNTQSTYGFIIFNTELERDNFTTFMLQTGWQFMCKVMKAMRTDCTVAFSKYIPKVDWTKSWTVEELLRDFGYTDIEIAEILLDLNANN